jgi:HTH-type transcriptional regulator/antitoxin HipB
MMQIARTPKQIGAAFQRWRRQRHLTQANLGEKTHLRQATISALEAGAPGTELRTVCEVMAALGLEFVIQPRSKGSASDIESLF